MSNEIHKTFIYILCLQFDALSFLSFIPVTKEHAKAFYKLRLVFVTSKGTNITSLEFPGRYCLNIVGDSLPPSDICLRPENVDAPFFRALCYFSMTTHMQEKWNC